MDWLGFKCLLETAMKNGLIILAKLEWIYISSYKQTHIDTYLPELSLDVLAICQSHSI